MLLLKSSVLFWSSYTDLFIGAPLFMDRSSDGKLQEVGQVTICLQRASGGFHTAKLNGFEIFARFGSSIAPLGDLDQDGFNGRIWIPGQDLLVVEGAQAAQRVWILHTNPRRCSRERVWDAEV